MDKFQPVVRVQSLVQEFFVTVCFVRKPVNDRLTFKKVRPRCQASGEDIGRGESDGANVAARSVWQQSHEPEFPPHFLHICWCSRSSAHHQ